MSIIEKLGISKIPWRCVNSDKLAHIFGYDTHNHDLMIVKTIRDNVVLDKTWDRQIKDHKLIATAPEMLEALIKINDAMTNSSKSPANLNGEIRNSVKLIEKATSKSWEEIKELLS